MHPKFLIFALRSLLLPPGHPTIFLLFGFGGSISVRRRCGDGDDPIAPVASLLEALVLSPRCS
jgi:hypothetical protein